LSASTWFYAMAVNWSSDATGWRTFSLKDIRLQAPANFTSMDSSRGFLWEIGFQIPRSKAASWTSVSFCCRAVSKDLGNDSAADFAAGKWNFSNEGGLILVCELGERLGFGKLVKPHLTERRRGKNTSLPLADLLRQSIYSRLAGYKDVNDAERLSQDPAFRLIGSSKIWERGAMLTSRLQSFETELLTQAENLVGLAPLTLG
jgi:hypothetical protein